jgi:hypothetical protein
MTAIDRINKLKESSQWTADGLLKRVFLASRTILGQSQMWDYAGEGIKLEDLQKAAQSIAQELNNAGRGVGRPKIRQILQKHLMKITPKTAQGMKREWNYDPPVSDKEFADMLDEIHYSEPF